MNRFSTVARPCLLLLASVAFATAQEAAPNPQPPDELRALRESVEQQNKQIQALTQQIAELNRNVSSGKMAAPSPTPEPAAAPAPLPRPASTPPAPPSPPSLTPATPAPTPAPPPAAAANVPAPSAPGAPAKPTPAVAADGVKHTVAKGETLTSIAKRYNISLSELENANKITDERKLQIGHVLNIPSAPNKAPEPQTDNKENP